MIFYEVISWRLGALRSPESFVWELLKVLYSWILMWAFTQQGVYIVTHQPRLSFIDWIHVYTELWGLLGKQIQNIKVHYTIWSIAERILVKSLWRHNCFQHVPLPLPWSEKYLRLPWSGKISCIRDHWPTSRTIPLAYIILSSPMLCATSGVFPVLLEAF